MVKLKGLVDATHHALSNKLDCMRRAGSDTKGRKADQKKGPGTACTPNYSSRLRELQGGRVEVYRSLDTRRFEKKEVQQLQAASCIELLLPV